uniref:Uncharacterized protein LOC102803367 n=1 Tax=Saccoglossus kowalevskii TaxID=10224 RepID=A0ABM0M3R4_SACKO|nr:PREDICTED: uncharacterized protein LOC102803367 [Saccoglossus kowalevskii]
MISFMIFMCEFSCNKRLPRCCAGRTKNMNFLTLISEQTTSLLGAQDDEDERIRRQQRKCRSDLCKDVRGKLEETEKRIQELEERLNDKGNGAIINRRHGSLASSIFKYSDIDDLDSVSYDTSAAVQFHESSV